MARVLVLSSYAVSQSNLFSAI
uniref:Uncharacterized protein n=1 Tax=Arundo donax TaxID=35708 RepID=A0A0A8YQ96_ARUDO